MGTKYFKESMENPTFENIMKNIASFQGEDAKEDPELQEIQEMVSEIMKEDLELKSGFDLVKFGVQVAAIQSNGKMNKEMEEKAEKVTSRVQKFFEKKMRPVMRQMVKEQTELMMVEAIRYMKEIIYLIWIIFSLAMCSGVAVENPVLERQTKIRYYLNVLGLG